MAHTVKLKPRAEKEYAKLAPSARQQVFDALVELEKSARPAGAVPLKGTAAKYGFWRYRTGDYRIIYTQPDNAGVLWVAKVGDRKDVYRFIGSL